MDLLLVKQDWQDIIKSEISKPYFGELLHFTTSEYKNHTVFPTQENVFTALSKTSYKDTRVVILGQDPYIKPGEAHGLAFSVQKGCKIPPSLRNVFKELKSDLGEEFETPTHGCLDNWAEQGVLLLNAVLTVRVGESRSHAGRGWEKFTDFLIAELNKKPEPIVFMLWGKDAEKKAALITSNTRHLVLVAAHPSPLARGAFFGCKHFSKTNAFLQKNNRGIIDWRI